MVAKNSVSMMDACSSGLINKWLPLKKEKLYNPFNFTVEEIKKMSCLSRCAYGTCTATMIVGGALLILSGPAAAYFVLPALGVPATLAGLSGAAALSSTAMFGTAVGVATLVRHELRKLNISECTIFLTALSLSLGSAFAVSGFAAMGAFGAASIADGIVIAYLGAYAVAAPVIGGNVLYYGSKRVVTYLCPIIRNFCADLCT